MAPNRTLPHRSRQALSTLRRDATRVAKRVMLRVGLVPPPLHVQIDFTDHCNFHCPTCSKWQADGSSTELSLDDWALILERIRNLPLLGKISVSGGEPFTRPDLLDFLTQAKQQGLEVVLITNGWFLERSTIDQLESIRVEQLMVSLNSLHATAHDATRGQPGSHARVLKAIEAWRAQPRTLGFSLSTVVMEGNCDELVRLAQFSEAQGLSGILYQVLAAQEAHYPFSNEARMPHPPSAWYTHDPRWVRSDDVLRQQIEELLQMQRRGSAVLNPSSQLRRFPMYYQDPDAIRRLPCLGTLSRMYIDPFGDMRVCYGYPPIGNVLRDDPRQAWRSERAQRIRRDSRKCTQLCRMLNNNF